MNSTISLDLHFLSHNVMSGLIEYIFFFFLFTLQITCVIIVSSLVYYGIPDCANDWASVSCEFSWALFLLHFFARVKVQYQQGYRAPG